MQLVLNTWGTTLRRAGEMFEINARGEKFRVAARKVQSILVHRGISITSDAIQLAVQNNIDIVIMDDFGRVYGRFWHAKLGSTARIRQAQLKITQAREGLELGLRWVKDKLSNQIEFLKLMRSRRTRISAVLTEAITALREALEKVERLSGTITELRGTILGIEGSAGRRYWEAYSRLLPAKFRFDERSRHPARDGANAVLNYGYGVLYGAVERATIIAGLDPYIGFVHVDHYNKVSLVYDVIEKYRIWVEEVVVNLFSTRKLDEHCFTALRHGVSLNEQGKKIFLPALNTYLDTGIRYRGRNLRRRDCLQLDMHAFAQQLLKWDQGEYEDGKED